ncbi:MAG: hypothetical protein R3C97_14585 [Geminicoccaceae bacterium]
MRTDKTALLRHLGVLALVSVLAANAPRAVSSGETHPVEITGRPAVTDHYRYLVDRSRDLVIDGVSEVRNAHASALLEVVDSRDDGVMFSWTLEQIELGGRAGLDVENITSQLVTRLTGFPVVYWTDPAGSMVEITNFERLREKLEAGTERMLDAIETTMQEEGATDTQIEGARDLATEILRKIVGQPPSQLGFQLFPEASLASYSFGMSFVPGEPTIYTSSEPSPLGGPPLTLAGELTALDYDGENERVTISWKESFAPDAVESFMRAFAEMLEERAGLGAGGDARTVPIDRADHDHRPARRTSRRPA